MNPMYKVLCRLVQSAFRAVMPILPYRQPQRLDRLEQVTPLLQSLSLDRVLLPYVLDAYGHAVDKPLHELAVAAGLAAAQEDDSTAAARFIEAVRQLNRRLGIPAVLEGIREEDIPRMARHAAREANPLYPVPVLMDEQQLAGFYARVAGEQERAA